MASMLAFFCIQETPKNLPPSPWKLPIIGRFHLLIFALPHRRLTELAKRHGSVIQLQLEAVKEVMKTHDINFANRHFLLAAEIILEEHVSSLIRSIYSNIGLEIKLGEMLCNLSYNITLRTAFTERCKQYEAFILFVKKFVESLAGFSIADLFPSIKLLHVISGMRAKLERFHHDLDSMLESIIEEHRASNANLENKKAQAEVRQVYDRTGDVNESDLYVLKYLKLVIKETLRLHPPVPMLLQRENTERCEINGCEIPAKTKVIVNAWAIGRDSNYWNEAERFNPERFINCSIEYSGANFEFIPFGAGMMMCPRMSYGMAIVELSLAQLLYHFDWKLPNGMKTEDLDMTDAFCVTVRRK
ncbi:hypothetical protein V6Z11_D01G094300 [Gossypium hirsutum]